MSVDDQKPEGSQGRRPERWIRRRDKRRRLQLAWVFEIFHQEGVERSRIVIARVRLTHDGVILVLRDHPAQTITIRREDTRSSREDEIRTTAREWRRVLTDAEEGQSVQRLLVDQGGRRLPPF